MSIQYFSKVGNLPDTLGTVRQGEMYDPLVATPPSGRTILKGGTVVDPANDLETVKDIAFLGKFIKEVADQIDPEAGDRVFNVEGLLVFPGLIDMHLHLGDLFEVTTGPIFGAVADGVTVGLSPGAGNTFMAPSLLGSEVDRGVPLNMGVYIGALNAFGSMLSDNELIALFKGELDEETAFSKMTRNRITYLTAPLVVGIKDHMGHWISSDEHIERVYNVSSSAGLIFMSHTQDPAHAERLVHLSNNRPIHLAHATAAGCGTHTDAREGMQQVVDLIRQPNVSGEFVTTMLRPGRGSREGLQMPKAAQEVAYEAISSGIVDVLISDGQNDATMKGFGDTRDNVPCILELAEMGLLSLSQSVATMTSNPAKLIGELTHQDWWTRELGHLGEGARANITVVDKDDKLPTYTFVNGVMAGMENRVVREANGAGGWVSKFGILERTGVGDLAAFGYVLD
jgi:dihydroorotase